MIFYYLHCFAGTTEMVALLSVATNKEGNNSKLQGFFRVKK
jgi:hypothetical protein